MLVIGGFKLGIRAVTVDADETVDSFYSVDRTFIGWQQPRAI